MEKIILTTGHFDSEKRIVLEEDVPIQSDSFEIIIRPLRKNKIDRQAGTLKGLIHISNDFDEPLEDFKEYQ